MAWKWTLLGCQVCQGLMTFNTAYYYQYNVNSIFTIDAPVVLLKGSN